MGKGKRIRAARRAADRSQQKDPWVTCDHCGRGYEREGGVVTMGGDTLPIMSSCPHCGGKNTRYLNEPDRTHHEPLIVDQYGGDMVQAVNALILDMIESGASADALADQIETTQPKFKAFAQWLRENPWFMTLSASVLSAVLAVLLTHLINHPDAPQQQITNIIRKQVVIESP